VRQSPQPFDVVTAFARVRRRLRLVLDAGRRHHLADERFYSLLDRAEPGRRREPGPAAASEPTRTIDGRIDRVAPVL
jgi:hypothetical protein